MDDSKKTISYSIQQRLSLSLSLLIIFIGVLSGCYNFYTAKLDAKEWQDNYLLQILHITQNQEQKKITDSNQIIAVNNEADTNLYIVKLLPNQNNVTISKRTLFNITPDITKGLHTLAGDIGNYRVAISKSPTGERLIIAQSTIERDELVAANAVNALIPIFLLIPLIILLLQKYIAHLFIPIKAASSAINKSQHHDFLAISLCDIPKEIHPFIISINQLLSRVSEHISMQQRFIAEAAHELRSPLTALSLQAERLDSLVVSEQAKTQVEVLRSGIERNRNLVSQLLTLARAQSNQNLITTSISLPATIKMVLEELMPLAEQKNIDIGVVESHNIYIQANEYELCTLFKNLIDNAIKYSDENGVIDISIKQTRKSTAVSILDSGSGIEKKEIEHVFSPFYRGSTSDAIGTGLGLSIVKTIADKLNATIKMHYIDNVGFQVTIIFIKGTHQNEICAL